MGWFGNFARSAGSVGNDVSNARMANDQLAVQAAKDRLAQIMSQLQIQDIQNRLSEFGQVKPSGVERGPNGELTGIVFNPKTQKYESQPLASGSAPAGIDKEKFRNQLLQQANDPTASPVEKKVLTGLIGSLDAGMTPEKVAEDYNRFLASRSETGTGPKPELKTEIFGGYKWQYDPEKKITGKRDATGQYVQLGPAKDPGSGEGGIKTPFELWLRTHPKGTYDQWLAQSKQEDRTDATKAVSTAMSAYKEMQSLTLQIQRMNRTFSIWNEKTWGTDPVTNTLAQQAKADYEAKRQDAVEKLTDAGMPVPQWLQATNGGSDLPPGVDAGSVKVIK